MCSCAIVFVGVFCKCACVCWCSILKYAILVAITSDYVN